MERTVGTQRADRWPALDRTLVITLLFLSFIDAAALWALPRLIDAQAWMLLTFLVATTVLLNVVYLSRRRWSMPIKYLLPGTVFLLVFQVYPVLYSAYVSTTNLGTGNILSKDAAIRQIELASLSPSVEEGRFRATAVRDGDGNLALFLVDPAGRELLGTEDELRELAPDDIERDGETLVEAAGYRPLSLREAQDVQRELSALEIPAEDGIIRLQTFNAAALQRYTRVYDPETDTVTDLETGTVYTPVDGRFTAEDGSRITPGWQTGIGLDNYRRVLTSEAIRGPFLRVFVWNWAFAALSVLFTFAVGLGLAITLNNELMHGQRVYRSLLIIPYALPSFMSALIWQGMLNRDFGIVNELLGMRIPWLTDDWMARASVLLVNTWLGFPYMFLVATGALQSVPGELREAAEMDGASPLQAFRRITFPLLMIPLAPLLIASFAFNFNNFNVIYLLNRGGPPIVGAQTPAGHTDILISYTYRLAFEGGRGQDLGLAAAISVMIFFMVAAFAAVSFRRTRALEDLA
jgi:arabinogalactan oligomer / maltooligosaccharide transport system permease protein